MCGRVWRHVWVLWRMRCLTRDGVRYFFSEALWQRRGKIEGLPRGAFFLKYILRTYQAHDWLEVCLERMHPTIKGDQRARETKKSACKTPTFRSISLAHVEHRGRLREETALALGGPRCRRSASGFLHVGEKVGELINWWESGRAGKTHLWLGHTGAPHGQ